jgi:hypothetical protein
MVASFEPEVEVGLRCAARFADVGACEFAAFVEVGDIGDVAVNVEFGGGQIEFEVGGEAGADDTGPPLADCTLSRSLLGGVAGREKRDDVVEILAMDGFAEVGERCPYLVFGRAARRVGGRVCFDLGG